MSYRCVRALVLACTGVGALLSITGHANAGGFALREQSAWGQGASYAGVAAGGSLSAMFWNPATMTQRPGLQSESVATAILPYSANTVTGGTLTAVPFLNSGTGNIALDAVVPSSYYSWQINPQTWIGLSINTPFGLTENLPDMWAGRDYGAGGSHLATFNATPSIAYAINNWISVGFGVQIQYADATLTKGIGALPTVQASIDGAGMGYGFTAGVTFTPTPNTEFGIGYRSGINQKINGTLIVPAFLPATSYGSVSTTLKLPGMVSAGLRQRLNAQWTALATVEWTNWSRIGTSNVAQPSGAPATVAGVVVTIPFQYKDGWFYALGLEYQWDPKLALRAGVAFEDSPIPDQNRIPVLPDNDRTWLSFGGTYQYSNKLSFDFAYSHLFVKNAPIAVAAGNPSFNGAVTYFGNVSSHVDIISLALKYRWDDPPAPAKGKMIVK